MGFPHGFPVLDTEQMFHPVVATWLERRFGAPTPAQAQAWPLIAAGQGRPDHRADRLGQDAGRVPVCLDRLVAEAIAAGGELPDRTSVLYVSPLKALSNDIRRNLEEPLAELRGARDRARLPGARRPRPRCAPGDTPARERAQAALHPPHVLVTTPESLYILLTSESGRRGAARRADRDRRRDPRRRGRQARRAPGAVARAAGGAGRRRRAAAADRPVGDGAAARRSRRACSWARPPAARRSSTSASAASSTSRSRSRTTSSARCAPTSSGPSSTTASPRWRASTARRWCSSTRAGWSSAWRTHLGERLGDEAGRRPPRQPVARAPPRRRAAAQGGRARVVVATASLELGIDVGAVDLVVPVGSPRSIATVLQRVGRSGHALRATPKGRLFPLTRDQLVECAALVRAVAPRRARRASRLRDAPLDILAQQIVAAVRRRGVGRGRAVRAGRAGPRPTASSARDEFDAVVDMLSEGIATSRGRAGALAAPRRASTGGCAARRGARLAALTSGGAIPDNADYDVVLEPEGTRRRHGRRGLRHRVMAGDIFLLGNTSWRIRRVEPARVRVEDAHGRGADDPVLARRGAGAHARAVGRGRRRCARRSRRRGARRGRRDALARWTTLRARSRAAPSCCATTSRPGAPRSARVPTADARRRRALLRRGRRHAARHPRAVRRPHQPRLGPGAAQALLPQLRLRAAGGGHRRRHRALAGPAAQLPARDDVLDAARRRRRGGADAGGAAGADVRDALALERDALAGAAAPPGRQARAAAAAAHARRGPARGGVSRRRPACQDNHGGGADRAARPPAGARDHARLPGRGDGRRGPARGAARRSPTADISASARETPEPSRVRARDPQRQPVRVPRRRAAGGAPHARRGACAAGCPPTVASASAALDPAAIAAVVAEAQPDRARRRRAARSAARRRRAARGDGRARGWADLFEALVRRSARGPPRRAMPRHWVAAERRSVARGRVARSPLHARRRRAAVAPGRAARRRRARCAEIVRGACWRSWARRRPAALAARLRRVASSDADAALARLEIEGAVLRGRFRAPDARRRTATEWCDRRLLARIHRRTLDGLRREIEPVTRRRLHALPVRAGSTCGPARSSTAAPACARVIAQLQGFELRPARGSARSCPRAWPATTRRGSTRSASPASVAWGRLAPRDPAGGAPTPRGADRAGCAARDLCRGCWRPRDGATCADDGAVARRRATCSRSSRAPGASFLDESSPATRRLRAEVEDALWELVAAGRVTGDGFAGLRALLSATQPRGGARARWHARWRRRTRGGAVGAGRWSLLRPRRARAAGDSPERRLADETRPRRSRASTSAATASCSAICWRASRSAPPWRDLVRVYRRLEMRGELRGGRFVGGFVGEQFALPEARRGAARRAPRARSAARSSACRPAIR